MSASTLLGGKADGAQTSFGTEVMSVAVTRASMRAACFAIEPPSEFPTMPTPLEQSMVGERQSTASGLASPEKTRVVCRQRSVPNEVAVVLTEPARCGLAGQVPVLRHLDHRERPPEGDGMRCPPRQETGPEAEWPARGRDVDEKWGTPGHEFAAGLSLYGIGTSASYGRGEPSSRVNVPSMRSVDGAEPKPCAVPRKRLATLARRFMSTVLSNEVDRIGKCRE
eukprot:scaffold8176_cov60-Phaeocystis_antarctica.AAC.4